MKNRRLSIFLSFCFLYGLSCSSGKQGSLDQDRESIEMAIESIESRKPKLARSHLAKVLNKGGSSRYRCSAQFLLGQSHRIEVREDKALRTFKVVASNPSCPKALRGRSLVEAADIYQSQSLFDLARASVIDAGSYQQDLIPIQRDIVFPLYKLITEARHVGLKDPVYTSQLILPLDRELAKYKQVDDVRFRNVWLQVFERALTYPSRLDNIYDLRGELYVNYALQPILVDLMNWSRSQGISSRFEDLYQGRLEKILEPLEKMKVGAEDFQELVSLYWALLEDYKRSQVADDSQVLAWIQSTEKKLDRLVAERERSKVEMASESESNLKRNWKVLTLEEFDRLERQRKAPPKLKKGYLLIDLDSDLLNPQRP